MITAGTETMLITSASAVRNAANTSLQVALAGDGFVVRHDAQVVGKVPEINLVLLQVDLADLSDAPSPTPLTFSDDSPLCDGDFVIALGNPQGPRGGASLGLVVGRSSSSMSEPPALTPGTAEAAMAEAEAEVEADALRRGEEPFIVVDAALVDGASGGPMLDAEGAVVGINTLVISAGDDTTRYYTVSSRRCMRAIEGLVSRRALGEGVEGVRVVLRNDGVNKRERVASVLALAGLSEQAASLAMLSAHKTGRGVIGVFETAEEAAALCARLVEIDKGSQVDWLADGANGDGPGARWAQDLTFESEPCQFYRKEPRGTEGEDEGEAARPQLEA